MAPGAGGSQTSSHAAAPPHLVYVNQLTSMIASDWTTLFVSFQHLLLHDAKLAAMIAAEFYRMEPVLRQTLYALLNATAPEFANAEGKPRDFFVAVYDMGDQLKVRELKTAGIGALASISGTVTRTSEVHPELVVGYFTCMECGTVCGPVQQQFAFTPPRQCSNVACKNASAKRFELDADRSRFADWQRVRVQENADEIPPGSLPRSVDVILRNGAVERAKAGDKCTFTGMLVVVPDVGAILPAGVAPRAARRAAQDRTGAADLGIGGLKALGVRDLHYRTAFLACAVTRGVGSHGGQTLADDVGVVDDFTEDEKEQFHELARTMPETLYQRLAGSMAPTVYGHEDIKRGVLLQLVGGVHKRTHDGISLRGDLNVCVVGDPSTAKSQFLKYAVKFLPRAVYTSGKASSAAGLTASVARDPETGEFTIEAGALMLADNGVCCIDEFDKMDPADQVAIHEAMEQQTISITKAGISATLNARTSILAAANPIYGRYDRSKTLRQNVAISPPIMSRFDLFFIVLDDCDEVTDNAIANHIVNVHRYGQAPVHADVPLDILRRYVQYARTFTPVLSKEARAAIVQCYRRLRQGDAVGAAQTSYRVTVRQLESMIRLSEALARLHLDMVVRVKYVLEAFRLLRRSIITVESGRVDLDMDEELAQPALGQAIGGDGAMEAEEDMEGPPAGDDEPATQQADDAAAAAGKKEKMQISYEDYQRMLKQFVFRLREADSLAAGDAEPAEGEDRWWHDDGSVTQDKLVEWWLTTQDADDISQLGELMRLANKVISRLVRRDGILVCVDENPDEIAPGQRRLVVSPDVVLGNEAV